MRVNAKSIGQSMRESIRRLLERQYESQSEGYWSANTRVNQGGILAEVAGRIENRSAGKGGTLARI
jgi:hypothetical protein